LPSFSSSPLGFRLLPYLFAAPLRLLLIVLRLRLRRGD